jgi:hypothetical protein
MAAPAGPALPWGRSSDGASEQSSDTGDDFESSLRKIMLSAALGGLADGPPAKRARTNGSNTADALARACDAVEACRALAQAEDAMPNDLSAGQRIQVCSCAAADTLEGQQTHIMPQCGILGMYAGRALCRSSGSWRSMRGPAACGGALSWSRAGQGQCRRAKTCPLANQQQCPSGPSGEC